MVFFFEEERPANSPLIDLIWRTQTQGSGTFTSQAATHREIVISKINGEISVTLRGPETKATQADFAGDGEFFGIVFNMAAFMPHFPALDLIDRHDLNLPHASSKSFWLNGSAWELPTYDNADVFVARLARAGLLRRDELVADVLRGYPPDVSMRTVRRRFLRVTGMTPNEIHQIERARRAMTLLQQGVSILDTVEMAGYYDQPHLTRSLKHYMGKTPAQVLAEREPVSLLYNTLS